MHETINKNIVLIISGSIAAYKSLDIIRALQERGATLEVIITRSGLEFITELSIKAMLGKEVITDKKFKNNPKMPHIKLAKWADVVLVVPASANIIAEIASGIASSLATSTILASSASIIIAPAMNKQMLANKATQNNLKVLRDRDINIVDSVYGKQICGDIGYGKLADKDTILEQVSRVFSDKKLTNKRIVITAGTTREAIDSVRFISNNSSGKMALCLANEAINRGAELVFIYGQIQVEPPKKAKLLKIVTANDMYSAVMSNIKDKDIFIACAAVCDYRPKNQYANKINKDKNNALTIDLVLNKDILADVCKLKNKPFSVGFAAQTSDLLASAKKKYLDKKCDLLIANNVSRSDIGFNSDDNEVYIFHKNGREKIAKNRKAKIAQKIIDFITLKLP